MPRILFFFIVLLLVGCVTGPAGFIQNMNDKVGEPYTSATEPYKFKDTQDRVYVPTKPYKKYCILSEEPDGYGNHYYYYCVTEEEGLTHITRDKAGNIIYHWFLDDIPAPNNPDVRGYCKIYYVVDPKTNIILDWGFDVENGGNPKSCQVWR